MSAIVIPQIFTCMTFPNNKNAGLGLLYNKTKTHARWRVFLWLFLLCAAPVYATPLIQFAGFAYSGAYQDIQIAYPYTKAINTKNAQGISLLNQALEARLVHQHFKGFRFNDSALGRIHSNNPLALAFVLTSENVSIEHIGSTYKTLIILTGQALLYNEAKREVMVDYPIGFQYVDLFHTRPSQSTLQNLVRKLYVGHLSANIFRTFVKRLHTMRLRSQYGHTIRVMAVHIAPRAMAPLPPAQKANLLALKSFIADQFSADLSVHNHMPVLPYMEGNAIGNVIALRFANGKVFNLTVPQPDYSLILTLAGFKKLLYQQGSWGKSWLYGVFVHVKLLEPLSGHAYMNAMIKQAAIKIVPQSQTTVRNWPAYDATLSNLLDQLSVAIAHPTRHWAGIHMDHARDVSQLSAFKKVARSCR